MIDSQPDLLYTTDTDFCQDLTTHSTAFYRTSMDSEPDDPACPKDTDISRRLVLLLLALAILFEMAPVKCSYFGCSNNSEHKSMFRFPLADQSRRETWLANCGNMTITSLTPNELYNRYICTDHFDDHFIKIKDGGKRTRLSNVAIPRHYKNQEVTNQEEPSTSTESNTSPTVLKVLTPVKTYGRLPHPPPSPQERYASELLTHDFGLHTPKRHKRHREEDDIDTPKCKKLKSSIKSSAKLLKQKTNLLNRLKNKHAGKKCVNLEKFNFKSESSKVIAKMQFRQNTKKWSENEKNFCLSLYYKSPSAYKHLLQSGVVLAHPSTIQRWLQNTSCVPGLSSDVFNNIKKKFADSSIKDRACTVCLDEMSIMSCLEYSKKFDVIEGFEDFGKDERTGEMAKYALVFVARGIYSNFKLPVAYFLSHNNVKAEKLAFLIRTVINKLFDSGLIPKVVVSDQATTNVKSIKMLGATTDEPFFFVNDRKIFAIFDVPHIIKNLRNNLLNSHFKIDEKEISFNDIIELYNIDKNNNSRAVKKLTPVHLQPNNFQKMRVSLATQVFSHSVAAAMRTVVETKELRSNTAMDTADFIEKVNNIFDALNSKNKLDSNPYRCALTRNNTIVRKTLNDGVKTFKKLKKVTIKKNGQKKLTVPPCFEGLVQTINAVLQLSAEEFTPGTGVNFLITNRLNQDVIENLFGVYRIKSGCNKNPTARVLRCIFRSNLLNNLIRLKNTNCEADNDHYVTTVQKKSEPPQNYEHPPSHNIVEYSQTIYDQPSTSSSTTRHVAEEAEEYVHLYSQTDLNDQPSTSSSTTRHVAEEEEEYVHLYSQTDLNDQPSTSSSTTRHVAEEEEEYVHLYSQTDLNDQPSTSSLTKHHIEEEEHSNLSIEQCSIMYFAGWLGKVCKEKFHCEICNTLLLNDHVNLEDKRQLLIIKKTYENITTPTLKSPTDFLFNLTEKCLNIFEDKFPSLKHKRNIVNILRNMIERELNIDLQNYHCYEHLSYIIEKAMQVKIFHHCKTTKKSVRSANPKLRILQNN